MRGKKLTCNKNLIRHIKTIYTLKYQVWKSTWQKNLPFFVRDRREGKKHTIIIFRVSPGWLNTYCTNVCELQHTETTVLKSVWKQCWHRHCSKNLTAHTKFWEFMSRWSCISCYQGNECCLLVVRCVVMMSLPGLTYSSVSLYFWGL